MIFMLDFKSSAHVGNKNKDKKLIVCIEGLIFLNITDWNNLYIIILHQSSIQSYFRIPPIHFLPLATELKEPTDQ